MEMIQALVLGLVEGATEFLPVSSTGHLVLLGHFMGFESKQKTFEIMVQLGAILAILIVYAHKLTTLLKALPFDPKARRFVICVAVAFLPAVILGLTFGTFIKAYLFNPLVVCVSLIVGGLILLIVDDMPQEATIHDIMDLPVATCAKIGLCQCIAMIPGVSRSGATIVSGMLLGADKRTAAEFSFFLAMPTMMGAFSYEFIKNYNFFTTRDVTLLSIGFAAAFVSGLVVVRSFLDFISRHGFLLFAWWRIIVGVLGIAGLIVFG